MKLCFRQRAIVASFLCLAAGSSSSAVVVGTDFGGANLILGNGDVLQGSFTNVGNFVIPFGATVYVANGTALSVAAQQVTVAGWLSGMGAGYAGGLHGQSGLAGQGAGGGAGGAFGAYVHSSGGAGGGGAGAGGNGGSSLGSSPGTAAGGVANAALMGSGGGAAGDQGGGHTGVGGNGGAGGGAISIHAAVALHLTGGISAAGRDGLQGVAGSYPVSGGGGGAGGTIDLFSAFLNLDGALDASGGDGADYIGSPVYSSAYGNGGGGGGGGRILLAGQASFGTQYQADVAGGAAGASLNLDGNRPRSSAINALAGQAGVINNQTVPAVNNVPVPATPLLVALGLLGTALVGRRRAAA